MSLISVAVIMDILKKQKYFFVVEIVINLDWEHKLFHIAWEAGCFAVS